MMTRMHFTAIAQCIKDAKGNFNSLVWLLTTMCKQSNPNFNEDRFILACNMPLVNIE